MQSLVYSVFVLLYLSHVSIETPVHPGSAVPFMRKCCFDLFAVFLLFLFSSLVTVAALNK